MSTTLALRAEPTWAVILVKSFARAKSRLSPQLAPPQRRALARALFARVLRACLESEAIAHVLVASDGDDVALACAGDARITVLRDPSPRAPLARIAQRALEHAGAQGARRAALVMADLPLVRANDLDELCGWLDRASLVVAPDRTRRGVGALACTLPCALGVELGHRDSLDRNVRAALDAGARVHVACNPRLATDIDTALDLDQVVSALPL